MLLLESFLSFLFPPVCGICGKIDKDWLCPMCKDKIRNIRTETIRQKLNKVIDSHCYLFPYQSEIQKLILKYKYENSAYLCETFVKIFLDSKKACDFLKGYDIIIPVPMYGKKKKSRGYNQTELIAKKLAKKLNIQYEEECLKKVKDTIPQKELNRKERKNNVKDVYVCQKKETIEMKKVILLDDVYTTGNTLLECGKVIRKSGALAVGAITIAKD